MYYREVQNNLAKHQKFNSYFLSALIYNAGMGKNLEFRIFEFQ